MCQTAVAYSAPTPVGRVGGFALVATFEIQGRAVQSATVAHRADRRAGGNPFADFTQQALVVGIQAHVTIAMVDDQQQAGADAAGGPEQPGPSASDEDVVDADFEEVKDDEKK